MKQIAGNVTMEDGVRWLGPGVTLFAPGKDGGRDGKFKLRRIQEAPRTALIRVTREARPAAGTANGFAGSP
jgi:hypothetical protein